MALPHPGRLGRVRYSATGATSSYAEILGIQDATLDFAGGTIDVTDHDSGTFREFINDRTSATIELTLNYEEGDGSQDALIDAAIWQTRLYFQFRPKGNASNQQEYRAVGIVTKATIATPNNGQATLAVSIQLVGSVDQLAQS